MADNLPMFHPTKQMMQACELYAQGHGVHAIADIMHKGQDTIRRWLKMPEIQAIYRDLLRESLTPMVARAQKCISDKIDSPLEWVSLQASQMAINKYSDKVLGEDDRDIVVRIEGLPDLGTPNQPED